MKDKKKLLDVLIKNKYVLIVVLAGIVLILLPIGGERKTEALEKPGAAAEVAGFSLSEQEKRISDALSEIEGAGSVTVVLTLKSSAEQILATDKQSSGKTASGDMSADEKETTVVITAGSQTQSPVTLKYIYPEYKGALIVAEGADNASVRLELLDAVAGLTGLGTDKITVTKMKNS